VISGVWIATGFRLWLAATAVGLVVIALAANIWWVTVEGQMKIMRAETHMRTAALKAKEHESVAACLILVVAASGFLAVELLLVILN